MFTFFRHVIVGCSLPRICLSLLSSLPNLRKEQLENEINRTCTYRSWNHSRLSNVAETTVVSKETRVMKRAKNCYEDKRSRRACLLKRVTTLGKNYKKKYRKSTEHESVAPRVKTLFSKSVG